MNWMHYLLEANLYLVAFYALYLLLLRNDTHYQLNRVYLLGTSALSFIIPFLQLGVLKPVIEQTTHIDIGDGGAYTATVLPQTSAAIAAPEWTINEYILLIYTIIVLVLLVNLCIRIYLLMALAKKGSVRDNDGFNVIELHQGSVAFSFFNNMFIDDRLASSQTILHHEQVHIRQKHSWDIIYLELLKIVNWFNPVVYLLTASIKELHEFIADEQTASLENSNDSYTDFLISNAYGITQNSLTNSFFNKNLLKRRIIMLYQKKSGKSARLKYLLALPMIGGLLCLSTMAFTSKTYGWIDVMPKTKNIDPKAVIKNNIESVTEAPKLNDTSDYAKGWKQAELDMKKMPLIVVNRKTSTLMPPPNFDWDNADHNDYARLLNIDPVVIKTVNKLTPAEAASKYHRKTPNGALEITTQIKFPPPIVKPDPTQDAGGPIYNAVDHSPEFPGGEDGFSEFLKNNIRYPKEAKDKNVSGRVFIQFIVEKSGSLSDIKVLREPGSGLGDEALRVMKLSPKWKPGTQKGKAVRVMYTVPVNFALENSDMTKNPEVSKRVQDAATKFLNDRQDKQKNGDSPAMFPGGTDGLAKFLRTNIRYPRQAKESGISGKVLVKFNVEEDGNLTDMQILRDPGTGLGDEAIRVMKLSPKWTPAIKDGQNISTEFTLPINFSLSDDTKKTTKYSKLYISKDSVVLVLYKGLTQNQIEGYKIKLKERKINLKIDGVELNDDKTIKSIKFSINCNDGFSGGASGDLKENVGIGFYRIYNSSESPFGSGNMSQFQ